MVQHDAHRPQEAFSAAELAQFIRGEQALVHQFGNAVHLVQIFADPEQGVQIAQAALAFLQIGFDDIAAVAHALVTGFALGQLFGHEGAGGAGHHFLAEPGIGFVEQRLITPDEAGFQKGGAHRHVGTSDADHVVQAAGGVAHLQAQIPQQIEQSFDDLFAPRRLLPRRDEHDVHIGKRRHLAAAVATHRRQRQPFGLGGIGQRIEAGHHRIAGKAQQLIGQEALGGGHFQAAAGVRFQPFGNLGTASEQRPTQRICEQTAAIGKILAAGQPAGQAIGQGTAIDDRAAVVDGINPQHCSAA